jgi:hypothetical protein
MSDPDVRKIFGTPEEWHRNSFTETKHGVVDVALGGGLFGIVSGSLAGPFYGLVKGLSGAIMMGFIGALIGAIGGALIGTVVGGIGELICGKFGLDRLLRVKLGGRLDGGRGRLLYGALLGLIGGPIIMVIVRGIYEGFVGILNWVFIGATLWGICGAVGGGMDWVFSWGFRAGRDERAVIIGAGSGLLSGLICGSIFWVLSGAITTTIIGVIVLTIVGLGVGLMISEVLK